MTKLLMVVGCILLFLLLSQVVDRIVRELANKRNVSAYRVGYLTKITYFAMLFCTIAVVCLVLGLGYGDVALFLSSVFAVVGIALFAQWSILSNITASVIIFFGFPYRVGDRIRVLDPDATFTGVIQEITMFHVIVTLDEGDTVTYPNSLMLQRAVLKVGGSEDRAVDD
ncbi:mechanosensitive ion channel [Gilvimarinus sp. SDUM040013]|uniref:Small-conductance mechanosensitive channel n=1 Tax=Gilvimarinus gilvus TaxID=3058038 RepID=A0ABU4RX63_9GAMM|nr:mechanosensitive ion channel domain-containing protein [Gilvimarinus sp. SDUM040013]MDO3385276.1 mechanosensitive ion channel [Gilvimarinus sp. SDUM040013]MDX6849259.1 mechanosensitive ion channel [Gilvimarinus sp. SDUM040013]